ncbi:PRC-barrel domain-containing protein [Streptomyces sp. NRRL F-5123]|uniref:PRC-barrel domain-containing protein n=1 Tax=Streptomyces sp. NRRL F-5123 TaxID=1463856 RepID=UPI0005B77A1E|nr:PRC-barrel domain-containing protein [Streptomyces sp. NRRL F-5123]
MQTDIDPRSLIGRRAVDRDGTKIGTVDEVYLDDATGSPEWAAVRTGFFTRDAFVPLEPSELVGEALRVPYKKSQIRDAPDFGVGRHLSPEQELQLYHHYGMDVPTEPPDPPGSAGTPGGRGSGPRDFGDLPSGDGRPDDAG